MKIMLVDDKPHVRNHLKLMLKQLHFKEEVILEANCDQEALRLITEHEPDIIVTDAKLLLLGEAPLSERLANTQYPQSTIIVTSSHPFVLEAFSKGGIVSLLKPIDTRELEGALMRAFAVTG
ncbi:MULTISPECIES: response regulator [unclassified Paenibacillus]|uniref:response regulator n=1 Tax=unclassified Paenibacillus TaxID=185978 RepID=UPI00311981A1